ncbi:MAG TPA: isoprenylcysteine carboxylmethyltransferase family protein [Candidatus Binatus sp.]|jgi:protein-S-isoprenylcysteine O-methyltransferase Ste14|nr:isoprenylcysteine carboxylmethyltransferase family protein [Candidatus Binatus sp.]
MMTYNPAALARFVFFAVLTAWVAFAALFIFYKQPSKGKNRARDPISVAGLALQMVGYFLVFSFARKYYSPIFPMPAAAAFALAIFTAAMAFGSVWFCLLAIRALGKQWALVARVMEGHELVMRGPYGIVRNPIYLGMFGILVATGLAVSRWQALVAGVVLFLIGTELRIRREEKLLRPAFGEKFNQYARRVPAFFPRVF